MKRVTRYYSRKEAPKAYAGFHLKWYCLRCEMPGVCKCGKNDKKFHHDTRVRPPLSTKNKVEFRKFLEACPTFVNMVPEELRPDFRALLTKVKYFDRVINGQQWTRVSAS